MRMRGSAAVQERGALWMVRFRDLEDRVIAYYNSNVV